MIRLPDPSSAKRWCDEARTGGRTLGFVPTMGALHEGHLSLVRRAARENDASCASVFVNPLQFDEAADLESYPRDLERDARLLAEVGCGMLFTGTLAEFFPEAARPEEISSIDPGPAAAGLEGEQRPGHFAGVATIVARLFELVRPTRAYFGEKDFQQTLVVRHVAADLGYPEIVVCPTAREPDGLALSSRNARLSVEARRRAAVVHRALRAARDAWRDGERDADELRTRLRAVLAQPGIEVEYAALRDPEAWSAGAPSGRLERARALVAARVGGVRLIDNLALDAPETTPGRAPRGAGS